MTAKEKEFKKGTRFELKGDIYVVTEELDSRNWIHYEYEDKRTHEKLKTMRFMPMSEHWKIAKILPIHEDQ